MRKIGKARKLYKDKKAVSPVIGVILMVAITVILAAIIAMHVFGIVDTVPETKTVSIYGYRNDTTTVSFVVTSIEPFGTTITNITSNVGNDITETEFGIGDEFSITGVTKGERVVLTAAFIDGSPQVVYVSKL